MKNGKKIFAILALSTLAFNYSFATGVVNTGTVNTGTVNPTETVSTNMNSGTIVDIARVDGVEFLDEKTLSIKLSKSFDGISQDSEVKILEDLPVVSSTKDMDNAKKITVLLDSDLVDGSSYSLVSVGEGLDTSIDFDLSGDKTKILNTNFSKDETSIEYITVVDSKNIEIYLNKDLTTTQLEFKMFKELKVESTFLDTTNLNVKMLDALISKKDYIAILSLKDLTNKDIEVENSLYDFVTPEFAVSTPIVEPSTEVIPETAPMVDTTGTDLANTATGESTEVVAMNNVAQTPDTGTKTNILLLLTFLLTLTLFLLRRKSFKI